MLSCIQELSPIVSDSPTICTIKRDNVNYIQLHGEKFYYMFKQVSETYVEPVYELVDQKYKLSVVPGQIFLTTVDGNMKLLDAITKSEISLIQTLPSGFIAQEVEWLGLFKLNEDDEKQGRLIYAIKFVAANGSNQRASPGKQVITFSNGEIISNMLLPESAQVKFNQYLVFTEPYGHQQSQTVFIDIFTNEKLMFPNCYNIISLIKNNKSLFYAHINIPNYGSKRQIIVRKSNLSKECVVCQNDFQSIFAISPCGHTSTCEACLNKINVCPICRTRIESKIKIYV